MQPRDESRLVPRTACFCGIWVEVDARAFKPRGVWLDELMHAPRIDAAWRSTHLDLVQNSHLCPSRQAARNESTRTFLDKSSTEPIK
jgi:hypothetical protein